MSYDHVSGSSFDSFDRSCKEFPHRVGIGSVLPSPSGKSQFGPLCESQFRPVVRTGLPNSATPLENIGQTRNRAFCGGQNGEPKKVVRTGSQGQSTASESQFGPDLVRTGSLVVRTGSKWSELARSELARTKQIL